jgi:hypothetical protein
VEQDSVDRHIAHWIKEIPDLDPLVEGVITRMQLLVKHLKQQRHATIAVRELEDHEYDTLHMLGGCPGNQATPTEIAAWLHMSPAAITGRLDALERRGFVRRMSVPGTAAKCRSNSPRPAVASGEQRAASRAPRRCGSWPRSSRASSRS